MIDISVITVSYNTKDLLLKCLKSVERFTKGVEYEVIVVDNASSDGTVNELKTQNLKLIENKENRGFGAANNQGIKIASGRYILFLNSDTELVEDSISTMVNWMDSNPHVGIASCKLVNSDGTLQPTGGFFPNIARVFLWTTFLDDIPLFGGSAYHPKPSFYKKERSLDWVTGAFFLARREVINDIKKFDEDYFLYVEEVDLCYRAKKKKWDIRFVPITSLVHHQGASGTTNGMITREFSGLETFYKKHYSIVEQLLLRIFLFIGCLARIVVFGIINRRLAKIYARAITKI